MKILIAEDDAICRLVLQKTLQKWGHTVTTASDGDEAWSRFETGEFPIVISDWMMPGCDGLELVRRVRGAGRTGYVYIILLTAKSQKEDVVAGMEAGADDFVSKPFDQDELHARLRAGERIIQLEQTLARRNQELETANGAVVSANARMKRDLEAAARIQASLMPQSMPDVAGVRFAYAFRPCEELAGDILNIVRLDERHVGVYVLDVSNHGVPAALLAVSLSRVLSPLMYQSSLLKKPLSTAPGYRVAEPSEVAAELNKQFPMHPVTGQYFTLLYGVLDLETHQFNYVQAGHPSPILVRSASPTAEVFEGCGLPIGFVEEVAYQEQQVNLRSRDRLYLYSDGIPEARNSQDEQFGEARMLSLFSQARSLPLNDSLSFILEEIGRWCGGLGFDDDVSLLAIEAAGD